MGLSEYGIRESAASGLDWAGGTYRSKDLRFVCLDMRYGRRIQVEARLVLLFWARPSH